ncbi:BglG family transcription antiterminator [Pseudalkalibacillus decolorationis]|uniref:BglG family transcription antiterminator n=1 Tax=Pseudalkalibacillus decolorationis TaxID=163879 RepID=UPI0021493A36|nr:BglG family transcription antiterminator [Pseudalkalibacillus decolorationis]
MNARQKEILRILFTHSDEYRLVKKFAESLDCSEKTVRNDLKRIQQYLEEHSTAVLVRKPGLGVHLEIDDSEKTRLFKKIHFDRFPVKEQGDEERIIQIAYYLLMNTKPVTVQDLLSRYFVSKTMIKKDLDKIEAWMGRQDLVLVSKQKVGLTVEGTEKNRRLALARLSELISNIELTHQFIKKQFSTHEVTIVQNELAELQKKQSLYFTDETFDRLLLHTLLMIKRAKLKQTISISEEEISFLKDKKEYIWVIEFLKKLESFFSVRFPEEERVYLGLHFLGGKIRYLHENGKDKTDELTEHNPVLSMVLYQLIDDMSELNMIDFNEDTELINGLTVHLYTTLNRLKHNLPVTNPMLHDIKKMYPYMFDTIIHVLEEINQMTSLEIPEEEAAYLTLHFQASIERLKDDDRNMKDAVIVCHMGIGMSQLLQTKIDRKFHSVNVIACIARSELKHFLEKHPVDLVISTVSLPELDVPHVVISPLLEASDEERLEQLVKRLDNPIYDDSKESVLLHYVNPFLVFLQMEETDRYEIINKLSDSLYEKGYVEKEYTPNSIIRERMSATTIGSGIAIPHGHPSFIRQSAIAIATLKEPIKWGTEHVSLIFMLAVKNDGHEDIKRLFVEISQISEQPELIQKLIKETDIMNFLSHLNH